MKILDVHDIHELRVELLGENMTFLTDAGVLARKWLTLWESTY